MKSANCLTQEDIKTTKNTQGKHQNFTNANKLKQK